MPWRWPLPTRICKCESHTLQSENLLDDDDRCGYIEPISGPFVGRVLEEVGMKESKTGCSWLIYVKTYLYFLSLSRWRV